MLTNLVGILSTTPAPSWVDTSWVSSVADALADVFSVMTQPPISIFVAVGLIGVIVGLIKSFIPR